MGMLEDYINSRADLWGEANRTLRGKPYRFDGERLVQQREFLRQPLADDSKYKTYRKSRQCGISENSVTELLYLSLMRPYSKFMYVFPTNSAMKDFCQTRVDTTIATSPIINSLMGKGRNNIKTKRIGTCDLFFRSGSKSGTGEGVDLDGIFFDERDRMNKDILTAFTESLSSSELGIIRDISTPSLPNTGVDLSFGESDQKYWFVKCNKCGKKQVMTWPDSIVFRKSTGNYVYVCLHCGGVDCLNRREGEWVAKITDTKQKWSGYQISQLDCPWITPDEIMYKKGKFFPQFFYNYVLGIPYVGDNMLITQNVILRCIHAHLPSINASCRIIAGVDWGNISWMVVGAITAQEQIVILHYERISDLDPEAHTNRVTELINSMNIATTVCDSGYGTDRNSILFRRFPSANKVWACTYPSTKRSKIVDAVWANKKRTCTINRTSALMLMARGWQQGEFILPGVVVNSNPETLTYFKHLKSLAIKMEQEKDDGEVLRSIGNIGDDHYAHATTYLYMAYAKIVGRKFCTAGFLDSEKDHTVPKGITLAKAE